MKEIIELLQDIDDLEVEYTPTITDGAVLRCKRKGNSWSYSRNRLMLHFYVADEYIENISKVQNIVEAVKPDRDLHGIFKEVSLFFNDKINEENADA